MIRMTFQWIRNSALFKNVMVLVVTCLLLFVLLELGLRTYPPSYMVDESVFLKHSAHNPFLIFGPNVDDIVYQREGSSVLWNSQGFRMDGDLSRLAGDDEYRIFALGGSTTENHPNGENLHYCGEATDILEDKRFSVGDVFCVNAAKGGFTTAHSLVRLQFDLLSFNPDMITVMHNINDLTVNFFPSNNQTNYGNKYLTHSFAPKVNIRNSVLKKIKTLVFIDRSITNIKENFAARQFEKGDYESDMRYNPRRTRLEFKEQFRDNLVSLARVARAHGIDVVFMTQPAVFSEEMIVKAFSFDPRNEIALFPPHDEFEALFEEYNDVIRSTAHEQSVHLIDMADLFGNDEKYFVDMVHYSAAGVKRFGEIYSEHIELILENKNREE